MQRDLLKARLARLPHLPPAYPSVVAATEDDRTAAAPDDSQPDHTGDDEDEDEERDSFDFMTAPAVRPGRRRIGLGGGASSSTAIAAQYAPRTAEGSFNSALEVSVPVSDVWAGVQEGPDHAAEALATFRTYYTPPTTTAGAESGNGTVFVCVHGAGYSALSFAELAKALTTTTGEGDAEGPKVGVLAYDARGHGKTRLPAPPATEGRQDARPAVNLSLDHLSADLVSLLKTVFPDRERAPALVLVGHSMGGAVVADACNRIQHEVADVTGVAVIDVVEGTALDALPNMAALIAGQPKQFDTQEDAIAWHVHSRTINNLESARISVPPLLRPIEGDPLPEATDARPQGPYEWRVELDKTEPYWRGWFTGLSNKFLGCKTAKLLLLAGTDRLDKELLIGQMQGRYQLEVYPDVGHNVHEDAPDRTAQTLLEFWERNDRTDVLRGVKKVGQA